MGSMERKISICTNQWKLKSPFKMMLRDLMLLTRIMKKNKKMPINNKKRKFLKKKRNLFV